MDLSGLLAGVAWPMVSRVLTALGLGVVTYTGMSTAITTAVNAAKTAWSGLGMEVLQLLSMAGIFEAISISIGGITGALALIAFKRFGLITSGT